MKPIACAFGLSATSLTVDADAPLEDLFNDTSCLFRSGLDALNEVTEVIGNDDRGSPLWAALYALRQAYAVFGVIYDRAHELARVGDEAPMSGRLTRMAGGGACQLGTRHEDAA